MAYRRRYTPRRSFGRARFTRRFTRRFARRSFRGRRYRR